jgi:hypothetical protein
MNHKNKVYAAKAFPIKEKGLLSYLQKVKNKEQEVITAESTRPLSSGSLVNGRFKLPNSSSIIRKIGPFSSSA